MRVIQIVHEVDQDHGVESNCVEYPPFQLLSDKTDIIREWQAATIQRIVCTYKSWVYTVCAQVFEEKFQHEVTPSEEMLITLRNERFPEKVFPSTYDFE